MPEAIKPKKTGAMDDIPVGLWHKCPKCRMMLYGKELERNLRVCTHCQYHFPLSAVDRIAMLADDNQFAEIDADMQPCNPLDFPGYADKLARGQKNSGQNEAFRYGDTVIAAIPTVLGVASFSFMGGSMGSVVGEKVTRALERGVELKRPVLLVCASGGARMHEGIISLMQMAKTAAACEKLKAAGQVYIVVLTDPTTAGVFASFASLGDVLIAEPGALIGFAGPRVIEQNLKIKLPPGTHTSEFQLAHGMTDLVVHRRDLRNYVANLLTYLTDARPEAVTSGNVNKE